MGKDLTIRPLHNKGNLTDKRILLYDTLDFVRDYYIFGQIANPDGSIAVPDKGLEVVVRTQPLPPCTKVELYDGEKKRVTREDKYGNELVYAFASDMKKLKLPENCEPRNKAIIAYLKALPKDTPVILEWH